MTDHACEGCELLGLVVDQIDRMADMQQIHTDGMTEMARVLLQLAQEIRFTEDSMATLRRMAN